MMSDEVSTALWMQTAENFALEEWIELSNGCLCCSVKTEMVQALETLMQKRHKFDYILIETTGMPSPSLRCLPCAPSKVCMQRQECEIMSG